MTYEKGVFAQADPGIVSGSTIERNKMSTKTIYKRIALVAVTALGAGVLSVAPASAASIATVVTLVDANASATSNAVATNGTLPVAAGLPVSLDVFVDSTAASIGAGTITVTFTVADPNGTAVLSSAGITAVAAPVANVTGAMNAGGTAIVLTYAATSSFTANVKIGNITFTPAMGGRYGVSTTTTIASTATADDNTGKAELTGADTLGAVYVSGSGAVVAASGKGTTTIGAVTGGIATVRFATDSHANSTVYNLISSGVGTIQSIADGAVAPASKPGIAGTTDFTQGVKVTTGANGNLNDVIATVSSTVAGTQTLTFTKIDAATGIPTVVATQVITWGAAPTLSVGLSTAFICAGDVSTCAADAVISAPLTAQTAVTSAAATIEVITRNSAGTSLLATQTITATVSGPGTLSIAATNTGTSQGRAITGAATMDIISVYGDGTAGTSTITISQGTTVIATKTLKFYGAVATLTAVQNHRIASSAGAALGAGTAAPTGADIANTPAVVITAKDSLGNLVPNLTITALSSDTTVMSSGIAVAGVTALPGTYNVGVTSVANTSGKTATLTFRVMSGLTVLAATAPVSYTLGGAVSTVALSLDKATYSVGAPAIATLTLKDSSGNAAFDADHTTILAGALASTLSVVKALQFNTLATTVSSLGGVATVAFNAPGTSGTTWTITGTTGTGPGVDKSKALTASAAVTSGADISALTTLINSLIAKINALNKLVIKIQKKVRA
jgi:trimeric autotransporter adhesin